MPFACLLLLWGLKSVLKALISHYLKFLHGIEHPGDAGIPRFRNHSLPSIDHWQHTGKVPIYSAPVDENLNELQIVPIAEERLTATLD